MGDGSWEMSAERLNTGRQAPGTEHREMSRERLNTWRQALGDARR